MINIPPVECEHIQSDHGMPRLVNVWLYDRTNNYHAGGLGWTMTDALFHAQEDLRAFCSRGQTIAPLYV